MIQSTPHAGRATPTLRQSIPTWVRVAAYSFGGPAGQIAVMQRLIVEERRWLSQGRFLHALSFCMLLPGPEAQQLATYIGWLMHRWRGALLAGGLFVLPGFLSILALSVLYALFRGSGPVEGLFFGIKPAVLAIVVQALLRIGRRALHGRRMLVVAAGAFVGIWVFGVPFPWIIAGAAAIGALSERLAPGSFAGPVTAAHPADHAAALLADDHRTEPPGLRRLAGTVLLWLVIWWVPVLLLAAVAGASHVLVQEALFFSKAAVVTFGGAYAVLAYIAQQAVDVYAWLQPGEMLDGLGMAETTPGPLIQVVQFVGFMGAWRNPGSLSPLTAALLGSVVTTWVTFAPCFLWILAGAPYIETLRNRRAIAGALGAITAAVTGVILNLSVWFATHTLFADTRLLAGYGIRIEIPVWALIRPGAAFIAGLAFLLLFRWRAGLFTTLGLTALAGIVWTTVAG